MIGTFGPYMSPSSSATRLPRDAQRDGQIHGDGRLADAALAGADRDDVLDALDGRTAQFRAGHRAHAGRHLDLDVPVTPGRAATTALRLIAQQVLDWTRRRRQLDHEGDTISPRSAAA